MYAPARASDPITSHEAAEHMTTSGKRAAQQALTAKAVEQYPGLTSMELSRRSRIDRYMLARRLSECEEAGHVRRGQERRCSVSGRTALTWWPPGEVEQLSLPMERVA
jgi:hypothetical protein